jgi:EAL domain-containing protein (putative c-di-GMP-specific phosphodiesterase class I)/GGDEF domain-containing protein
VEAVTGNDSAPVSTSVSASGVVRRIDELAMKAQELLTTQPEESARIALSIIELSRAEGDRLSTARAMLLLSQAALASGSKPSEVYAPVRVAIAQLGDLGDTRNECEAQLLLAKLLFEESALEDAASITRRAARLARSCSDMHLEARADLRMAAILAEFPGFEQALNARRHFKQASEAFLKMGDEPTAAIAVLNMAINSLMARESAEAFELAARALDLRPDPAMLPSIHMVRAIAAARCGWARVASVELAEAESLLGAVHSARVTVELEYARGVVLRHAGEHEEAEAALLVAIDLVHGLRDSFRTVMYLGELSELRAERGDMGGALDAARSQHNAQTEALINDGVRRIRSLEVTARLEDERNRTEELAHSYGELQTSVAASQAKLSSAMEELQLERSRRSLVELRNTGRPGIEPRTGLPDLTAIAGSIRELLERCARVAVVVITIDDDRLAAPLPDDRQRLIQEVSARAYDFLRKIDGAIAGSLGSEDLVAILPLVDSPQDYKAVLARLHAILVSPVDLVDRKVGVNIQFGVALAPEHGNRPNGLLSRARLAAQAARQSRPHGPVVAVFTADVEERQHLRNFVHENLTQAIENNVLTVNYQPIIDSDGKTSAVEALVRWNDATRGPIGPADFIALAEETGQIVELGGYVLKQACCDAAGWVSPDGSIAPPVAVNVSASQLVDGILTAQVDAALLLSGLRPARLSIELTETALANSRDAIPVLVGLRERGITIKIDDFGTGYSSFSYLTRFPVDCVKIDKSFVDRVAEGADDAAITASIISMAHSLRLTVVAEGVESQEQADLLRAQGCDGLQGYLFARPMPADAFRTWLSTQHLIAIG